MRPIRTAVRPAAVLALLGATLLLASCSGSSGGSGSGSSGGSGSGSSTASGASGGSGGASSADPSASASTSQPALSSAANLYVSVGDSYAASVQATGRGQRAPGRDGFADQTVTLAKSKGYDLKLVNFGCSGATTSSALKQPGCLDRNRAVGGPAYTTPQVTAAADFLRANRGKVALVTVVLGGNDITPCAATTTTAAATTCVTGALGSITANVTSTVQQLRNAAGPATRIVGVTYPDVFLGESLDGTTAGSEFAKLSVFAFQSFINPQLQSAYAKGGASFADVTTATGAYTPMTQTTTLAPYGTIPVAVAKVCQLTYFCQYRDIHPRTAGYAIIAGLVAKALPAR